MEDTRTEASQVSGQVSDRQSPANSDAEGKSPVKLTSRRTRAVVIFPLLALFALGGLTVVRWRQTQVPAAEITEAALPVTVASLKSDPFYVATQTYTGILEPRRSSQLGFERSGVITTIMVEEGDLVETGDLLATLDVQRLNAQRAELQAEKAQALSQLQEIQAGPRSEEIAEAEAAARDVQAQLQLARSQSQRRQVLLSEGAISQEQFDQSQSEESALVARLQVAQQQLERLQRGSRTEQIMAQQAAVDQLEARLATLDVDIQSSSLKARFDGQIAERLVDEGTVVSAGQAVVQLVEQASPEARIGIPVGVADQLQLGSRQTVEVAGESYPATLMALLPQLDEATRTVTAVLRLNASAALRAGQVARLAVEQVINAPGFWLPAEALVSSKRGLWSVYVLSPAEQAFQVEQQDVEVIHTEGDRVFIQGTLREGELVVSAATHRLVPGQLVQPAR